MLAAGGAGRSPTIFGESGTTRSTSTPSTVGRVVDVGPAKRAHLTPPHPTHEEEPGDHGVEAAAVEGHLLGLAAAAAPTRLVAGGEDGGEVCHHERPRLPPSSPAGRPPVAGEDPGRPFPGRRARLAVEPTLGGQGPAPPGRRRGRQRGRADAGFRAVNTNSSSAITPPRTHAAAPAVGPPEAAPPPKPAGTTPPAGRTRPEAAPPPKPAGTTPPAGRTRPEAAPPPKPAGTTPPAGRTRPEAAPPPPKPAGTTPARPLAFRPPGRPPSP